MQWKRSHQCCDALLGLKSWLVTSSPTMLQNPWWPGHQGLILMVNPFEQYLVLILIVNANHLQIWLKGNINFSGIGLLASFLSFEARKRISAREAMRNPYFENLGSGVALLKDSKYTLGLDTFFHLCPNIGLWWSSHIFRWCLHSRFPRLVWSQSTFSAPSLSLSVLFPQGVL